MVTTILRACDWLTENNLTVAQLRTKLASDTAPELRAAEVVAIPDSEEPSHVRVSAAAGYPLAELSKAFGAAKPLPRIHGDTPQQIIFYPPPPSARRFSCAVIADVQGELATQILLRRDPHLD